MVPFLLRFLILIAAIILQTSFFVNIFPPPFVPFVCMTLGISWVLVRNFRRSLIWLIALGLVLDIVSTHHLGVSMVMIVLIGYGASFLSKRFLTTHYLWGILALSVYVAGAAFSIIIFDMIVRDGIWPFESFWLTIGYAILNVIIFFGMYKVIQISEKYLSLFESRIDVKRHV